MWPIFDYIMAKLHIMAKLQSYQQDIDGLSKGVKYESNSSGVFNIKLRTLHMTSYNGNNYRRKESLKC